MLRSMSGDMDDARDPRLAGWSDRLYRTLVERIPAVVYIDSSDQRPDSLYISPQVQELLQSPPDAYVADPELWRRQTHPDDVERIAETWRQARIHERAFECEYRMIRADGAVIWVRDDAVPLRDEDGRITFWQGSSTTSRPASSTSRSSARPRRGTGRSSRTSPRSCTSWHPTTTGEPST